MSDCEVCHGSVAGESYIVAHFTDGTDKTFCGLSCLTDWNTDMIVARDLRRLY